MKIRHAVITAAGPKHNLLPLQHLVDRFGANRTALQLIVAEAVEAGMEHICIVVAPGDEDAYHRAAGEFANRLTFVAQTEAKGYGDALLRAHDVIGDVPFLHLVGDHLYLSRNSCGCARQLVQIAESHACAVSAVQATRENKLHLFGTVAGRRVPQSSDLYEITNVVEKPTPTLAEQELTIAGMRSSYYLCLFGLHVLTPAVMVALRELPVADGEPLQLSPALAILAERERYLAAEVQGVRYNIGVKYGLLLSQLALALSGADRDDVLTELLELVATSQRQA